MDPNILSLKLLQQLLDDLLIYEYKIVSSRTAAIVAMVDPDERFSHIEQLQDGTHQLWHKHLYNLSEEKRQKIRAAMREIGNLADKRDEIRKQVEKGIDTIVPCDKKFKKLRDAMVNKIMSGKACELAKMLGIDQSEIPQIDFWRINT